MRSIVRTCLWSGVVIGWLAMGGCGSSKSVRYYVLSTTAQRSPAADAASHGAGRTIRVGPVRLPAYLDRQQMVSRGAGNTVTIAQFDRWAEPLKDGVPRVLVENLTALLPQDTVIGYQSRGANAADYTVAVDIRRLDGAPGGRAELVARWMIKAGVTRPALRRTERPLAITVADDTYEALARAESELLTRLSVAIASDIKSLVTQTKD